MPPLFKLMNYSQLFEWRWRDKCDEPCVGNWSQCACRQWAWRQDIKNRKGE